MDPLKANANFTRICKLLINKGGDALRAALHVIHPPATLAAALNTHRRTLQTIRYSVIKPSQWQLLFPPSGNPDSKKFDITLLTILLRNICGLSSPAAGWNVMPPASDNSISANILRIKMYRNEVYGHIPSAQYDDATFERLWQEISKPLIKLLIIRGDIDELKVAPLSPEEESYIEKLKEWKELEDGLLKNFDDVERKIDDITSECKKLRDTVGTLNLSKVDQLAKFDFTGKIDVLCQKFQDGTREWFFDELSRWFTNRESRVMILTAGPGIGKSVLSAKVCELFKQRRELAAYHFCDFRKSDYANPSSILQSLASQMCDNVDGFRDKLTEILGHEHSRLSLSDAFRVLVHDPLHALERPKPMLIVVDALDESKTDDKSEFLELISDEFPELPKWIKILISSRPELQVKEELEHFKPVEIHPDDCHHETDLEKFFRGCLTNIDEYSVIEVVRMCEGSFLYAYYLVEELGKLTFVDKHKISDYAPKGISGYYKKQFQRLKTGLQRFNPSVFKAFVDVVAASRAPLPIKILLKCIDMSDEEYEIRNAIVNIMSEFLPVYNDCLTVYHKSLTDWLTLDGYEEHAFVADVADGTKRLWQVCRGVYEGIDFQKSAADFEISREREYALENGGEYLVFLGEVEDFHWLVHIRLNALKFLYCGDLNVDFARILRAYKSKRAEQLYWSILQHQSISRIISGLLMTYYCFIHDRLSSYVYLQCIANGHFDFVKNTISCKNTAKDFLDEIDEIWLDEVTGVNNSYCRIISHAVLPDILLSDIIVSSPDNKLLVYLDTKKVTILELPSLAIIFELKLSAVGHFRSFLTFSPDSSYFLCNSIRTCVCIKTQKESTFIPRAPAYIDSCSFSSCGLKLVTSDRAFIGVWDVKKKALLVRVGIAASTCRVLFSSCNRYVFRLDGIHQYYFHDSTTLKELGVRRFCYGSCLTDKDDLQIIPLPYLQYRNFIKLGHCHLPTGEMALFVWDRHCVKSFTWKNRKCVVSSNSSSALVVYDFINQEVIDRFQIDCLPYGTCINYVSKLDASNFVVCFHRNRVAVLSFETTEESCVAAFVNSFVKCCAVSPDDIYVACCYENCILTIKSIDNEETLQTVVLQHPPEACWWSESYLWVVCEGAIVVKFPYELTSTTVLKNDLEECNINFGRVFAFAEGVLVVDVYLNNKQEISIFKICDEKLCSQQIPDSISAFPFEVAISSDGRAVLLSDRQSYQLLEVAYGNRWELYSSGSLDNPSTIEVVWLGLTGTQNRRTSMWLKYDYDHGPTPDIFFDLIDFSTDRQCVYSGCTTMDGYDTKGACYVPPKFLLVYESELMHVVNVSDGSTITVLYLGNVSSRFIHASYLSSTDRFLLVFKDGIKYFKIHNLLES